MRPGCTAIDNIPTKLNKRKRSLKPSNAKNPGFLSLSPSPFLPPPLIKLLQIVKSRNLRTAVKPPLIRLLGQHPSLQPSLIAPLRRALRLPRPVEPPPPLLERVHLRLGEHLQKLLVAGAVIAGVRVGALARTLRAVLRRARGGQDRARGTTAGRRDHVQRSLPARPDADVVEVLRAVGVGLRPLAAQRGAETRGFVLRAQSLLGPAAAGEVYLVVVVQDDLVDVEDDVLVDVEEEVFLVLQLALPFVEAHEAVAEDYHAGEVVALDCVDGLAGPGYDAVGV
jgi:hypothetical protein